MKRLVISILAVLAIFTFIREYSAPLPRRLEHAQVETAPAR